MFCVDNLLIDKMVRDAHFQKKNLQLVDVKKEFDSVFHQWIIRTLKMHGIHSTLIHLTKSVMKLRRQGEAHREVDTNKGKGKIGPIK